MAGESFCLDPSPLSLRSFEYSVADSRLIAYRFELWRGHVAKIRFKNMIFRK